MSGDRKVVPISVIPGAEFAKPSDRPVAGDQRLVRHLPAGLPGTQGTLLPAIWISPYEVFDDDLQENVKICILLLTKGPPKPDVMAIRIAGEAINKFPMLPVEW